MMSTEELLVYAYHLWSNSAWDPDGTDLNDLYTAIIMAGSVEVVEDATYTYNGPEWDHWR